MRRVRVLRPSAPIGGAEMRRVRVLRPGAPIGGAEMRRVRVCAPVHVSARLRPKGGRRGREFAPGRTSDRGLSGKFAVPCAPAHIGPRAEPQLRSYVRPAATRARRRLGADMTVEDPRDAVRRSLNAGPGPEDGTVGEARRAAITNQP